MARRAPGMAARRVAPDGSFQIAVVAQPGLSRRPGPERRLCAPERSAVRCFRRESRVAAAFYAHAFLACDPKPTDATPGRQHCAPPEHDRERPGRRTGRSADPGCLDDQPRASSRPSSVPWLSWSARHHGSVKSGRFEIHGLDPDAEVPVYFLDPHHKLGATVNLSGKSAADGPVTVRLQPCGTAKARLVDASGKPLAGRLGSGLIAMVVTPGPYPIPRRGERNTFDCRCRNLVGDRLDQLRGWPRVRRLGADRVPRPGPRRDLPTQSLTVPREPRFPMNSPSSPARRSTWAIS